MADLPQAREPTLRPLASGCERQLNRTLERLASVLTSVVGLLLIVLVAVALVAMVRSTVEPLIHRRDFSHAAIDGLDAAFLVVILLELVHTTLSRGPVTRQIQEFLVVGVTSAVRSGLELAAERGTGPSVSVSLAVNSFAVLVLVGAFWLVRQSLLSEHVALSKAQRAIRLSSRPHGGSPMANTNIPEKFMPVLTDKKAFAHLATLMPDGSPQVTPVWFFYRDGKFVVNTARGRVKDKNMSTNASVALSITDPDNPYAHIAVRGKIVKVTEEGADANIDALAKKYLGQDKYPFRSPGEVRVIYEIEPLSVSAMG
jgi:PPOX class probable F420-dependent enzyme